MGTRADYYIGRGEAAEWLGSSGYDGYPSGQDSSLLTASTEEAYRSAVEDRIGEDDGTHPDQGWPWPWPSSHTTDYAYMFEDGDVWVSCFGHEWIRYSEWIEWSAAESAWEEWSENDDGGPGPEKPRELYDKAAEVPDMSSRKSVAFGKRSGVIVVG